MRWNCCIAAIAATVLVALGAALPATAGGFERPPEGWGAVRPITHHVYYPRYAHVYKVHGTTDPFAYRYEPRGYYPYYASHYWKHRSVAVRPHYARPPHYAAWGYPRKWEHRKWHHTHHGRHHFWHW